MPAIKSGAGLLQVGGGVRGTVGTVSIGLRGLDEPTKNITYNEFCKRFKSNYKKNTDKNHIKLTPSVYGYVKDEIFKICFKLWPKNCSKLHRLIKY